MNPPDLDAIPLDQPGARLRAWRLVHEMTLRVLATKLSCSAGQLERMEEGEVLPETTLAETIGRVTDGAVLFFRADESALAGAALSPSAGEPGEAAALSAASPTLDHETPGAAKSPPGDGAGAGAGALPTLPAPGEEATRGASSPSAPGFGIARHRSGRMGLVLIQHGLVTEIGRAEAAVLRGELDLLEGLLDDPLLFGFPE